MFRLQTSCYDFLESGVYFQYGVYNVCMFDKTAASGVGVQDSGKKDWLLGVFGENV